ncbi:MAG: helix-turn-helix transcriptional regulator [Chloroflexi bacterium]|nr:helix-turn-helix transcriptional regulator [Chloroflexota bacterium]
MNSYKLQADLFKALAHPTRLHILEILSQGEACVCHITTILKKRQPYVSQQLMLLREAGWVRDRKDGVMVYYRLADDRITEVIALGRSILEGMGVQLDPPEIPAAPVKGCPCPHCNQGEPCTP